MDRSGGKQESPWSRPVKTAGAWPALLVGQRKTDPAAGDPNVVDADGLGEMPEVFAHDPGFHQDQIPTYRIQWHPDTVTSVAQNREAKPTRNKVAFVGSDFLAASTGMGSRREQRPSTGRPATTLCLKSVAESRRVKSSIERVGGLTSSREKACRRITPTYTGRDRQIVDQLGRLFDFTESRNLMNDTLMVFISNRSDHLGNHWISDKDFFRDP